MVDSLLRYKTKNSEQVRSICHMPSDLSYNNVIIAVGEDTKVYGYLLSWFNYIVILNGVKQSLVWS